MASSSDVNIVLGQSDAIKEVHSVRKQALESSQQFMAQQTEDKKNQEKEKVKTFESEKRIEDEGEKRRGGDQQDSKKDGKKEHSAEQSESSEGNLIDITV
jgi:DNA polymerase III alpha subunit